MIEGITFQRHAWAKETKQRIAETLRYAEDNRNNDNECSQKLAECDRQDMD